MFNWGSLDGKLDFDINSCKVECVSLIGGSLDAEFTSDIEKCDRM